MDKPPIPNNELERLEELKLFQIIGIDERDDFDFITAMAAKICNTKISLISLVTEDKQWFLSHHGLSTKETNRDFSFCAHAINTPNLPFIIEDASKDDRFADNPLTTGDPHVIFYDGIPLQTSSGLPLGSLCVIDSEPKTLTEEQIDFLTKLADQVITIFDLRKKQVELDANNKKLERSNQTLEIIQAANQIGIWELDISTEEIIWTKIVYDIHELNQDYVINKEQGIKFYNREYRTIISKAIENAITTNSSFDVICLLNTAKGNQKWVRSVGKRVGDKLIGSFQDITALKQRELKFEGIFNSTMSFIGFLNIDGILLEANNTALNGAGIKREDVIGKYLWDCYWWEISKKTQQQLRDNFHKALKGEEVVYEVEVNIANNKTSTILFSLRPILDDQGKIIYIISEGSPIDDLVQTRDHFIAVLEGTNAGTFEWNVQTGKKVYNERWAEIVGYSLAELEPIDDETWIKLAHPDDIEEAGRKIQIVFDQKEDYYEMEARLKHKYGHWVWTLDYGKVVEWTSDGKPLMMYGTHQDITVRKNKSLELSYQKQILNALYELSPIGIALNDYETGQFIDVNDKLVAPTGYTKDEFLDLSYWDITPIPYKPLEELARSQMKEKGYYNKLEKEYLRKDGSSYPVALHGVVVNDLNGKKLIWSFVQDISLEKESQVKIHEAMNNLRAVLDATEQVAIIATDENGIISLFNSGAERMLGYTSEELVALHSSLILLIQEEIENESSKLSQKYGQKISGIQTLTFEAILEKNLAKEWTFRRKDGSKFPVLLSIKAVKNNNVITGFSAVAVDISVLKKAEDEIKSLLENTQEKNSRLRNFAHIVSHNLRSHSIGISGILDLIKLETPELYNNELVGLVNNSVENLKQTVEDLTEVVKVNLTQNIMIEIPIYDAVQKNIDLLILKSKEAGIIINNLLDKDLKIKGVPAYIDSISLNFITNSLKYRHTERNSYLKIYAVQDKSHHIICFEDNGLGINLTKHGEKIFGMYKTFHQHHESKGLGLFMTKNQIESMGGKIEVNSQENIGTIFKVFLLL
jgi:PAS domain S-box-containing protein